jgi:hypothetical protein
MMVIILTAGVIIPKLTVKDKVIVDAKLKKNILVAVYDGYDNPFERMALILGKSRVISHVPNCAEVESFTIFRIPLGVLRGQPNMKMSICLNIIEDYSTGIAK